MLSAVDVVESVVRERSAGVDCVSIGPTAELYATTVLPVTTAAVIVDDPAVGFMTFVRVTVKDVFAAISLVNVIVTTPLAIVQVVRTLST